MMAIGVPYIRLEYKSEVHKAFIPNHHYIVIPREDAFERFRQSGHEGVANLYIETYNRYKDKKSFLKFISNNFILLCLGKFNKIAKLANNCRPSVNALNTAIVFAMS